MLDERRTARATIIETLIGDEDEETDKICGPELEAIDRFAETSPTTVEGLLAMIAYADVIDNQSHDALAETPLMRPWRRRPRC